MLLIDEAPASLAEWVRLLSRVELPIRAKTATGLEMLARDEERVSPRELADVVLSDPLMTARVFATLAAIRRGRQGTDITKIEGSILMMGIPRFLASCKDLPTVEEQLNGRPEALRGLFRVMRRAQHAARLAWDIAVWRTDLEIEQITIAALLHDLGEMLLWCFAPDLAMRVRNAQKTEGLMRSRDAQHAVLGIELIDLALALAREWHLPELLVQMMDDHKSAHPRVRNVLYAVDVARHSATGWANPALPTDYERIAALLVTTPARARELVEGRQAVSA